MDNDVMRERIKALEADLDRLEDQLEKTLDELDASNDVILKIHGFHQMVCKRLHVPEDTTASRVLQIIGARSNMLGSYCIN